MSSPGFHTLELPKCKQSQVGVIFCLRLCVWIINGTTIQAGNTHYSFVRSCLTVCLTGLSSPATHSDGFFGAYVRDVQSYDGSLGWRASTTWSADAGLTLGGRAVDGGLTVVGSGEKLGESGRGGGGGGGFFEGWGWTRFRRRFLSRLLVMFNTISTTPRTLMSRANSTNSKIVSTDMPSHRPSTPPQSDKYWVNCIAVYTHVRVQTLLIETVSF